MKILRLLLRVKIERNLNRSLLRSIINKALAVIDRDSYEIIVNSARCLKLFQIFF